MTETPCKTCLKCHECESQNLYATLIIKKKVTTGEYIEHKFIYDCIDCGRNWVEDVRTTENKIDG